MSNKSEVAQPEAATEQPEAAPVLTIAERLAKVDEINKRSNAASETRTVTDEDFAALAVAGSVSNRIRYLHQQGFSTSNIAKILDKRYQHVRNVLKADEDRALIKRMEAAKAAARAEKAAES